MTTFSDSRLVEYPCLFSGPQFHMDALCSISLGRSMSVSTPFKNKLPCLHVCYMHTVSSDKGLDFLIYSHNQSTWLGSLKYHGWCNITMFVMELVLVKYRSY